MGYVCFYEGNMLCYERKGQQIVYDVKEVLWAMPFHDIFPMGLTHSRSQDVVLSVGNLFERLNSGN